MSTDRKLESILHEVPDGRAITKAEAEYLLTFEEHSLEAALIRSAANCASRKKFNNSGLLLGQIGVDMAPCDGNCAFCFFAKSFTQVQPAVLSTEDVIEKCRRFARGGARGVFLMTMHRFGFDWFLNLCSEVRKSIPENMRIFANVGDISLTQMKELREAGLSGAYHVCRLREGTDTCMTAEQRRATVEHIIEAGLDWYNLCEPVGPEHTPHELAEQIWLGVDLPCRQHGAMQRFPVPGSPLYSLGQISPLRLGQIAAVIALGTLNNAETKSIAVNVSNIIGLFSGANAFFPEAGEPDMETPPEKAPAEGAGFTTALWRSSGEITTADCREMLSAAGFSHLTDADGKAALELNP